MLLYEKLNPFVGEKNGYNTPMMTIHENHDMNHLNAITDHKIKPNFFMLHLLFRFNIYFFLRIDSASHANGWLQNLERPMGGLEG